MNRMAAASLALCASLTCVWGCNEEGRQQQEDVQGFDVSELATQDVADLVSKTDLEDGNDSVAQFTVEQQESLQAILDDYIRFSEEPSIAFAIEMGNKKWSGVAGESELQSGKPVSQQTRFRVGSNTKPITATWILMLVEEGKVDLDEPITTYLPQYPQWSGIKVRHLLGMESGLPEILSAPTTLLTVLSKPDSSFTPAQVLDFIKDVPVLFAPGEGCSYSNADFVVLGLIGEAVTGRQAALELKERIFDPLGMGETYLEMTGDSPELLAHGYMDLAVLGPLLKLPSLLLSLFDKELFLGESLMVDATTLLPPSLTWTAGSIVSVPADLATFQRALQSGRLLKRETVEAMRQVQPCNLFGGTVQYGLGMMRLESVEGPVFGHGGLNFGFHVETWYVPSLDVAYSHTHNVLPAEVVTVNQQAVAVAAGEVLPESCEIPASLFDAIDPQKPYVKLRFKGTVGDGSSVQHISGAGMGSARVRLGETEDRYYGFDCVGIYSEAALVSADGASTLSITAFGPSGNSTHLRRLDVSVDASQFNSADRDEFVSLDFSDPSKPFPAVTELTLVETSFAWTSECIVAVPDLTQQAKAYLCDGIESLDQGEMLRMGMAVAMTDESQAVEAYLEGAGIDRCICFDDTNRPVTCPD